MTTAYTSLLGFALPVTGELSGTWGDTVNNGITSLLDSAIAGTTTITLDQDVTLTTTQGSSNTAREAILLWTAGGSATRTITAPAQSKIYTVINASSGTQSIILAGAGPTSGVTIAKGESALCAWNGSDFIKISNTAGPGTFTNLTVTGNTSIGDADTDTITQAASYVTGTQLKSAKTATNTLSLAAYDVDGTAYTNLITLTASNTPTLALTSTGVGTINNMSIGATTASTGAFTTLSATDVIKQTGNPSLAAAGATEAFVAHNTGYGAVLYGQGTTYDVALLDRNTTPRLTVTTTAVAVTGTFSSTLGATIQGLTVGLGGGAVATNTAVGVSALAANTSGSTNTGVGYQAGYSNETGSRNTFSGAYSGYYNTTGSYNTAYGRSAYGALAGSATGSYNVAIGDSALQSNTTASFNTAVGYTALYTNQTGVENVAIGTLALYANTSDYNVAVGSSALRFAGALSFSTAVGYKAAYANTGGNSVTAIGYNAFGAATNPDAGVAVGKDAGGGANTTGTFNTYVGTESGYSTATGTSNTGIGGRALKLVSSGSYNVAVGYQAGTTIASAGSSTFIGTFAGLYATGAENTAVGYAALSANTNPSSGAYNTAIGVGSLQSNTTGGNNTAVGYQSLNGAQTASNNTALGHNAGYSTVSGANSVYIGASAGFNTTTSDNVIIGYGAGFYSVGSSNTFIGRSAGAYLTASASGGANVAIGRESLANLTSGADNTFVGYQSGYSLQGGSENTAIGYSAGSNITSGTYNVCLGRGAGQSQISTQSNNLYIARDNVGAGNAGCWIYGSSAGACTQGNNSSSWTTTSDARLKNVLGDSTKGLAEIMQVDVKNFKYKSKEEMPDFVFNELGAQLFEPDSTVVYTGPIAQQVQTPFPESVIASENGVLSVDSDPIFWAMLKAIQELKAEVDSLKSQLNGA